MKDIRRALSKKFLSAFSKKADGGGDRQWEVRGPADDDVGGDEKARRTDNDNGRGSSEQTLLAVSLTQSGHGSGEFAAAEPPPPPALPPPSPSAPPGEPNAFPSAVVAADAADAAAAPTNDRRIAVGCGDHITKPLNCVELNLVLGEGGGESEPFESDIRESRARQIQLMRIAAETLQKRASKLEGSAGKAKEAQRRASRWKERKDEETSREEGDRPLSPGEHGCGGGLEERGGGVDRSDRSGRSDRSKPFSEDGSVGKSHGRRRPWLEVVDLRREGGGEQGRRQDQRQNRQQQRQQLRQQLQQQQQQKQQHQKPARRKVPSSGGTRKDKEQRRDGKDKRREGGGDRERRRSREETERSEQTRRGDSTESKGRIQSGSLSRSREGRRNKSRQGGRDRIRTSSPLGRRGRRRRSRSSSGSGSWSRESRRKTWKRHLFSLGQQAKPCHMDDPTSFPEALVKIARLQKGDGAWVQRTKVGGGCGEGNGDGHVWTYAILKKRSQGSLVFIVNELGSTKECPVKYWTKFVKVVAPEYALKEEEKDQQEVLDAFVRKGNDGPRSGRADPSSGGRELASVPGHKTGRHEGSANRGEELASVPGIVRKGNKETSKRKDLSSEAKVKAGDNENDGRVDSSSKKEGPVPVPDHNVSTYTLGSEGDAPLAVVLQDHELSTYSLVGDGDDEDDAMIEPLSRDTQFFIGHTESSTGEEKPVLVPDHDVSMYTLGQRGNDQLLDDHNISVSEHDHDISMYTFRHGMTSAAADENKNRPATSPPAEVNVPNVDAKADCDTKPHSSHCQIPKMMSTNRRNTPTSESSEEGDGDPPDDARRRRPENPPATVPSGRGRHATNLPADGDHPEAASMAGLPSTSATGRGCVVPSKKPRRKTREAADDSAGNVSDSGGGKDGERCAVRLLSKSLQVTTSQKPISAEKRHTVKKLLSKSLPPATLPTPISESPGEETGLEAKVGCERWPGELSSHDVSGEVEEKRAIRQRSKPLPAAASQKSVPGFPGGETDTWTESPGRGWPEELPLPTATCPSYGEGVKAKKAGAVQQGCDVPTSAGGLVDTKTHHKKPPRRATGAQQLSKSLPSTKRVPISESCKDKTSVGLDSSRKEPTKETTQPVEMTTPNNEADFSSSTMTATRSVSSIFGPYLTKGHAEHKPARHDDDAKKGRNDTSSKNGKVSTTMKDRNVSMYTLDGGDAALLSSADSTILLLEYVSKQGPDMLAYVPCGSVILTKTDGTRTFPAAADSGRKVEMNHGDLNGLYESLHDLVDHSLRSDNKNDRTLRVGNVSGHTLDCGDSLILSSAGTTILLVEYISERGHDILAYAPCGAVVATKKNNAATPYAANDHPKAHGNQVKMKRAMELLSESLDYIMPPMFDLEDEASMRQVEESSRDDEEETNTLNDDSDKSGNNRADRIADFRQMCNSIQSESHHRQKRKPKRKNTSRRVSWSGELKK